MPSSFGSLCTMISARGTKVINATSLVITIDRKKHKSTNSLITPTVPDVPISNFLVNILLNMFFGPAVNAARGVAVQVQGAVSYFSSNFQMALNPQITKNYEMCIRDRFMRCAIHCTDSMLNVVFSVIRFSHSFFVFSVLEVSP